jgi:hypothetical protein
MNPWSKVNTGRNRPRKSSLDMFMTHIVWLLGTVTGCIVDRPGHLHLEAPQLLRLSLYWPWSGRNPT